VEEEQVLSSESQWNPVVDKEFEDLLGPAPPALFGTALPEHQFEGKYRLKTGDVYVEAGAFWGRYGLIASRRVGEAGRVILIEGNPYNLDVLGKVVSHYGLTNVQVAPGIVWSSDGVVDFCIEGNPAGSRKATESDRLNYPRSVISVQAWTLDRLLENLHVETVDLLACDIEGAEYEMVKGADRYLKEKRIRNVALCAYHAPGMPEKVSSFLKERGYATFYGGALPHYGGIVYGRSMEVF
jgi:FkbM family methyltransferase